MIDWKNGKQIEVTKPNESMIVFYFKDGRKHMLDGVTKLRCFVKTDKRKTKTQESQS